MLFSILIFAKAVMCYFTITTYLFINLFIHPHSTPAGILCMLGPISSREQFTDTEQFSLADLGRVIWACPGSSFVLQHPSEVLLLMLTSIIEILTIAILPLFPCNFCEDFITSFFRGWFLDFIWCWESQKTHKLQSEPFTCHHTRLQIARN